MAQSENNWGCGLLIVFVILVAGAFSGLRESGWIPRSHDTPVWIQGDWLVGEYRDCQMRTKTAPEDDKNIDYPDRLPRLFCGEDRNGVFDFQRESGLLSLLLPPADAKPPQEGAMYFVTVTSDELDHYFHVMPLRYFGRIDRTDKWVTSWRCQRLSESLECKALD